jgi:hypothetical protein
VVTELVTGADSVTVRLGDARVTLAPETAASIIRRAAGNIDIALDRGRVDCEVAKIPGRAPFRVGAADVEVTVVGTVFAVELGREVRVEVDRGVVAVRSAAGEVLVEAGKMWTAAGGVVAMVAAVEPDGEELIIDDGSDPDAGDRGGAGDDRDGSGAIAATTRDGVDRQAASARSASGRADPPPNQRAKDRAKHRAPKGAPPRHRAPDDPALLAAMELETKNPRAAIAEYSRIAAASRGRTASFALYSKAYVEHIRLGDKTAALGTLDLFKRRFPRAREAQSAQWLRVLGLCDLGRIGECRAAAYSYIRRFPNGKFVDAASLVVNKAGDNN